ncbi:hypothetical protein MXM51_01540 [Pantoea stewartii]|uniref:hypothetical protein n=1 Tax=Pantoea stewartii TaxID=66269 RepID=UPI002DBA8937|nr:hypothetical protein [Pantoea stewartii]MEB6533233.1 hypothetical protein [Pantoea stewartii]
MIKRYDHGVAHGDSQIPESFMCVSEKGAYVDYEDYAALQQKLNAAEAKIKQLEWDGVFIPKNIESALAVVGMALPESKEEFNFQINRWIQRLVDRVVRLGPELDAERNNLRAEGAELFSKHCFDKKAIRFWDSAGEEARIFAASLRSGTHDTADKAG